jgi:hypothetical protein
MWHVNGCDKCETRPVCWPGKFAEARFKLPWQEKSDDSRAQPFGRNKPWNTRSPPHLTTILSIHDAVPELIETEKYTDGVSVSLSLRWQVKKSNVIAQAHIKPSLAGHQFHNRPTERWVKSVGYRRPAGIQ